MDDFLLTDLATVNGDLATNMQGDMNTASGIDNLTLALQRRFETPLGALFYDDTYGNPVLSKLSQPMGQDFEKEAIADVTSAMLADPRVQSVNIQVNLNLENRTAAFYVQFVAIDGSTGAFESEVSRLV